MTKSKAVRKKHPKKRNLLQLNISKNGDKLSSLPDDYFFDRKETNTHCCEGLIGNPRNEAKDGLHVSGNSKRTLRAKNRFRKDRNVLRKASRSSRLAVSNVVSTRRLEPMRLNSNPYFLLAKHGHLLKELQFDKGDWKKWSSSKTWFLVDIKFDGTPWKLKSSDDYKTIVGICGKHEGISEVASNEKISRVEIPGSLTALRKEYLNYKNLHLQLAGHSALGEYLRIYRRKSRDTKGKCHQNIVWYDNSCALDAALSILPHICIRIVLSEMYTERLLGSNAMYHTPAASLLSAMLLLRTTKRVKITSSWARHLFCELACGSMNETEIETRGFAWSRFAFSNSYQKLDATLLGLKVLLGADCTRFGGIQVLPVLETPGSICKNVLEDAEDAGFRQSMTMSCFLYQSVRKSFASVRTGVYMVALENKEVVKCVEELMYTDWRGTFQSTYIELTAIAAPDPTIRDHFHAAACHFEGKQHLEVFNGMKNNGVSQVADIEDVMMSGIFSLSNSFLVFLARETKS